MQTSQPEAFSHHFHAHLASFADALMTRPAQGTVETRGNGLREPAPLAYRIDCFSADHDCRDGRAAASEWSKWVFARLIIPTLVVQLATNRQLICGWDDMSVGWYADATPRCFVVDADCFVAGDGADLAPLIDRLLCPLVETLTRYAGLSARVFWSNAAVYYDWAMGELTRQGRIPAERLATARTLLDARVRPDGGFNPFAGAYRACSPGALDGDDAPVTRCRRVCCVRDLDPEWGLCANCPRAVHFDHTSLAASDG
ncbi:siderophore-iron reductase FhuF [Salinisphaera orenii]|uniref:siderophore-iron reductase FhuF n=1 Tax=Salinisphaera orenii TaxID=856731 RepID=UPI000DBE5322